MNLPTLGIDFSLLIRFPNNPLTDVLRAVHDLHPVGLTASQEPNHINIDKRHFLQIQDEARSTRLELPFQFPNVL